MEYFTTSTNAMCWHSQLCKPALAGINNDDDDWEEESDDNDYMAENTMTMILHSAKINTTPSNSCPKQF